MHTNVEWLWRPETKAANGSSYFVCPWRSAIVNSQNTSEVLLFVVFHHSRHSMRGWSHPEIMENGSIPFFCFSAIWFPFSSSAQLYVRNPFSGTSPSHVPVNEITPVQCKPTRVEQWPIHCPSLSRLRHHSPRIRLQFWMVKGMDLRMQNWNTIVAPVPN